MKKQIIFGIVIITGGLLVALGPQFLFRVCNAAEESFPRCFWSARAEIGAGIIITALGISVLLFLKEAKTITGLSIGVFFSSIAALFIRKSGLIPRRTYGSRSAPAEGTQRYDRIWY